MPFFSFSSPQSLSSLLFNKTPYMKLCTHQCLAASPFKCIEQEKRWKGVLNVMKKRANKRGQVGEGWDWEGLRRAYGEEDGGGGMCVCVCVWGGGGGGRCRWGVEVRATDWHSVNCGLMKVLIMELVTFQPVTDPVSLIDPLWSVTRRQPSIVAVGHAPPARTRMHKHRRPPRHRPADRTKPPADVASNTCCRKDPCVPSPGVQLIAPINWMIE